MVIIIICLLTKKIYQFKADNKNVSFQTQFWQGDISERFYAFECIEIQSKDNGFDFDDTSTVTI